MLILKNLNLTRLIQTMLMMNRSNILKNKLLLIKIQKKKFKQDLLLNLGMMKLINKSQKLKRILLKNKLETINMVLKRFSKQKKIIHSNQITFYMIRFLPQKVKLSNLNAQKFLRINKVQHHSCFNL